jgi:hypothetical protein
MAQDFVAPQGREREITTQAPELKPEIDGIVKQRVLPSLEVKIMDKALIFIEKQVYKNGAHFGGEIPKGFEVFLRGHPSHIDSQFKCDQPQHRSANLQSAS